MLYGTTTQGGAHRQGVAFGMTTAGKERVLYTFGSDSDGAAPFAALTDFNGILYGVTAAGGATNNGTVFQISP